MRKQKIPVMLILGCVLLAGGTGMFLFSQLRTQMAVRHCGEVAARIEENLPPKTPGIPGSASDPAMPVWEIDGEDYIALIDVPAYGVTLPVTGNWDARRLSAQPCRFWGSVYDGSLVIGGNDQKGQFDFCDRINPGAEITVTAMSGEEFTCTVARVDRAKHAETDWLLREEWDLTLFTRSAFSLEYIAVRCEAFSD